MLDPKLFPACNLDLKCRHLHSAVESRSNHWNPYYQRDHRMGAEDESRSFACRLSSLRPSAIPIVVAVYRPVSAQEVDRVLEMVLVVVVRAQTQELTQYYGAKLFSRSHMKSKSRSMGSSLRNPLLLGLLQLSNLLRELVPEVQAICHRAS